MIKLLKLQLYKNVRDFELLAWLASQTESLLIVKFCVNKDNVSQISLLLPERKHLRSIFYKSQNSLQFTKATIYDCYSKFIRITTKCDVNRSKSLKKNDEDTDRYIDHLWLLTYFETNASRYLHRIIQRQRSRQLESYRRGNRN